MSFVHIGYKCNGCDVEPITGKRWHCYVCKRAGRDFNICDFCHTKFSHPHDLGAIKRHSTKVKEIHKVRDKDKRAGHIVDPNKYEYTPDKLNKRFTQQVMQEPVEKVSVRSKHARPRQQDAESSDDERGNYFADLI